MKWAARGGTGSFPVYGVGGAWQCSALLGVWGGRQRSGDCIGGSSLAVGSSPCHAPACAAPVTRRGKRGLFVFLAMVRLGRPPPYLGLTHERSSLPASPGPQDGASNSCHGLPCNCSRLRPRSACFSVVEDRVYDHWEDGDDEGRRSALIQHGTLDECIVQLLRSKDLTEAPCLDPARHSVTTAARPL